MKVYIDGEYFEKNNAKVSVFDHGLLYGDGIFEGIRIYQGKIFRLHEHLLRLYNSAKAIMLKIPLEILKMKEIVEKTVVLNQKENGYIRLLITRGKGNLGIDPFQCPEASVIIIVDDIQLYPEEYYSKGISIITSSIRQISLANRDSRIKSLNYLNNILAKIEAKQAGVLEAVMLNEQGHVTECTGDNIFIIRDSCLFTPNIQSGVLEGITRQVILEIAKESGILNRQVTLTRYDLYNADECFLTGTGAEIIPVTQIDGRKIGDGSPGKMTLDLIKGFKRTVSGEKKIGFL